MIPDITIVIPTYNNLELFKQALSSVLNQKGLIIEIVVVDDSTNNKIENYLIKNASSKIIYKKNHPKKGAVNNWNYGLKLARGKYVTVLHHDEYYLDRDNQLQNLFEKNQNKYDVLVSRINNVKSDGTVYQLILNKYLKNIVLNFFPSFLFFYNFIGPVSCVVFKNNSKVMFNNNMKWLVDVEWYQRLFKRKTIKYYNDFQIFSTIAHDEKITKNINIKNEFEIDLKELKKEYNFFSSIFFFSFLKYTIKK